MLVNRRHFLKSAAAGTAIAAAPAIVRAQTLKPLSIGYVPSTLFAPIFVAQERGYLKDAGFNATFTPIVAGQDSMALVSQSQLDVAAAALSAAFFNAVNRGLEVKFVASTGYQPRTGHPSALMVRQDLFDGGTRTAAALKGKRIGWNGGVGAASAYYVGRILRKVGLSLKDIEFTNIAVSDQEVALDRKAIDAVFASAPSTELFAQKKLAQIIATPPAGIAASGVFFGPSLWHSAESARAVMTAFRRGAADVAGKGYYSGDSIDASVKYTHQSAEIIRHADRYAFYPDLRIDQATLQDMQNEFASDGILAYKTPLNEVRLVARF